MVLTLALVKEEVWEVVQAVDKEVAAEVEAESGPAAKPQMGMALV